MIRTTLENLPDFPLPDGYKLRWYRAGDEESWLAIHLAADEYNVFTPGLFAEQFGLDAALLHQRQCYLCDSTGRAIGTASAWFSDGYHGLPWGRVHWVALMPEVQGKGLAKPLLSAVCHRLRELGHRRAYLTTSAVRLPAIGLYMKFGFEPEILSSEDERIWAEVQRQLKLSYKEDPERG